MNNEIVMRVEETFLLGEPGTVLTGRLEGGTLQENDRVCVQKGAERFEGSIGHLEVFRKAGSPAVAGDYVSFRIAHPGGRQWQDAEVRKL